MSYILRTEAFAKLFFFVSVIGLIIYAILAFTTFNAAYMSNEELYQDLKQSLVNPKVTKGNPKLNRKLKYILIWTVTEYTGNGLGKGQAPFINNKCLFQNCYVTTEKNILNDDYTNFDAVILDVNIISAWSNFTLPKNRDIGQKYIFYGRTAAEYAPICNIHADNYFNWTWSYKLYSDIVHPFIEVRDLKGNLVAPNSDVEWTSNITNLTDKEIRKMKMKPKAIAWVINNCDTKKKRMKFAKELQEDLKEHSLELDIYGCGMLVCPLNNCSKIIERDYYFYLAYEDHIEEDFVTEEVLKAYDNHVVPIVMGGADYEKFLPEGSYINARFQSTDRLAAFISYTIMNPDIYQSFFLWRNHYVISKVRLSTGICELCALLNDEVRMTTHSAYEMFRKWWIQGPLAEKCYPRGALDKKTLLSYLKNTNKGIMP